MMRHLIAVALLTAGAAKGAGLELREYPVPTSHAGLFDICNGPDGNVWFTEGKFGDDRVGRITPQGTITEFPTNYAEPYGIAVGPDRRIWFTGYLYGYIGRMELTGSYTLFAATGTPSGSSPRPTGITTGSDGALWYTMQGYARIGRMTIDGKVSEYQLGYHDADPRRIVEGPDGRVWFTEWFTPAIGAITVDGSISEYGVRGNPVDITRGPDGALWCTGGETRGPVLYRVTVAGAVTTYVLPGDPLSHADGIVTGPDGALWICEGARNAIARFTLDGRIREYFLPQPLSLPWAITVGPDGALWFTELAGNRIGRLDPNVFAEAVTGVPTLGWKALGAFAAALALLGLRVLSARVH